MENKGIGVAALIRDVHKLKELKIEQKYWEKHNELENKIQKTAEYQRFQKQIDELENQRNELKEARDKITEHLGSVSGFRDRARERLAQEFVKVRIAVTGIEVGDAKKIITEFAKKEYWEG